MTKIKLELGAIGGLDNDKRVRLLGIIDKIRELGVGEKVSLPQLVVVGDQSSGKSSLLEGLTGISFPVASDLCTRFATQIVLRRAPETSVKVTIIPGPSAQADDQTRMRLLEFARTLASDEFGNQQLQTIFDEAAERMGVPGPGTKDLENLNKRFSDDILKIELSGPEHHHLSVVDVPGLFHNPTKYQTAEDRAIIRKLIEDYITDKRTIVMAVMDARNNLANQEVFSMARAADPAGKRTVGIITKCDALQTGDEHQGTRNEVERLTHGWFLVKNRSTQEIAEGVTIGQRHERERQFFSTALPWNELDRNRLGISTLKTFLGRLLYDHISKEFPNVVKDIENLSQSVQEDLELLGPIRQTSTDQRRFLTRLANAYQRDVSNALSGNYAAGLESDSPLKLRMHIRNMNDNFAKEMGRKGHAKVFFTVTGEVDRDFARKNDNGNILDWIRETYRDSRGAELPGTVNPTVLENMFRQQSSPWEKITTRYLEKVHESIRSFNRVLLEQMSTDEDMRDKLSTKFYSIEEATRGRVKEQLAILLNDERGGILQTVNHYFADTLNAIREERITARLRAAGLHDGYEFNMGQVMGQIHLSNEDQAVNDIHDILKAYYKVACKRYTDNAVLQLVERIILGMEGPVRTLSPEAIGDLNDEELETLAGENFATSSARSDLIARHDRLRQALDVARQAGVQ